MTTGSVTLNGLDDADMVIVFEHKTKHEGIYSFNPQIMQSQVVPLVPGKPGTKTIYNNFVMGWQNPHGLKAVIELLQKIEHHRSQAGSQQA